jgi:hypothetical protein
MKFPTQGIRVVHLCERSRRAARALVMHLVLALLELLLVGRQSLLLPTAAALRAS